MEIITRQKLTFISIINTYIYIYISIRSTLYMTQKQNESQKKKINTLALKQDKIYLIL